LTGFAFKFLHVARKLYLAKLEKEAKEKEELHKTLSISTRIRESSYANIKIEKYNDGKNLYKRTKTEPSIVQSMFVSIRMDLKSIVDSHVTLDNYY
jgi:hypothetical protein